MKIAGGFQQYGQFQNEAWILERTYYKNSSRKNRVQSNRKARASMKAKINPDITADLAAYELLMIVVIYYW